MERGDFMTRARLLVIGVLSALPCAAVHADTAIASGELAFHRNCAACHSLEKGKNTIGPSLFSIYGRKSAAINDYGYSKALQNLNLNWSEKNLDAYIADVQRFAPGSKMWVKLPDAKTRESIIFFLKSQALPEK